MYKLPYVTNSIFIKINGVDRLIDKVYLKAK